MNDATEPKEAPRLRLSSNIDLTKADPRCDRCGGRGVVSLQDVDLGPEGVKKVPVICRCVSRAEGGVRPDTFDRILAETQKRLDDGTFGDALVSDIRKLPADAHERAIAGLVAQAARTDLDEQIRAQVASAVEQLRGGAAPRGDA